MDNLKRVLALVLMGTMTVGAANYSKKSNNSNNGNYDSSYVDVSISADANKTEDMLEEVMISQPREYLSESLYDESMDYNLVIQTYLNSWNKEMSDTDRESLKNDYLRAMYTFLSNTGIDMNILNNELHTMVEMSKHPGCIDPTVWNSSFPNLIAISKDYESLFELYIDYANYIESKPDIEQTLLLLK